MNQKPALLPCATRLVIGLAMAVTIGCNPALPDKALDRTESMLRAGEEAQAYHWLGLIARNSPKELFDRAEYLVLEARFEEAIPLLKAYLTRNPGHSGAHYYIGTCYYNAPESYWYAIAEGEIRAALALYNKDGQKSTIQRFSDEYFQLTCYLNLARIHGRQAVLAATQGLPVDIVRECLDKADVVLADARRASPDAKEIPFVQEGVDAIRKDLGQVKSETGSGPTAGQVI